MTAEGAPNASRNNRAVAAAVAGVALAMVGAAYAAVPLYAAFCKATGYGGTPQVATAGVAVKGQRVLSVRFDANVAPGLDWTLAPETPSIRLRTGETATVFFRARNLRASEGVAIASYNVSPEVSGAWFDKIACFCFSEQRLGPNESAEWPVVFFLDPKLETDRTMDKVDEITLSYTLFSPARPDKPVALAPAGGAAAPKL